MIAPFRTRGLQTYALVFVSLAAATALRYAADPWLGDHLSFSLYFLAVGVAAWAGGVWPAIVTAVISALLAEYFFTHPRGEIRIDAIEELLDLVLFVGVSLVIGLLSEISLRALQRAKVAEKAKDDFLTTLAHELRSPLSVIHYANTLNRLSPAEPAGENSEMIERQVQRINVMIQDLLDVSRIARGKIRLERQHIDVSDLVQAAVERVRPLLADREHKLVVEVSPEPMPLFADSARLEQVLTNLLTNAAKYTPEGGQISICAKPDRASAIIAVRDNGVGISPAMLPRVFDMFVQADAGSTAAEAGLGIGLALVRKLVELHGGTVTAASPGLNQGSEFVVSLPLEQPAAKRRELVRS